MDKETIKNIQMSAEHTLCRVSFLFHFIRLVRRAQFFLGRYMCRPCVIYSSSDNKLATVCNYISTKPPSVRLLVLPHPIANSAKDRHCCHRRHLRTLLHISPRTTSQMILSYGSSRRRNAIGARLLCAHGDRLTFLGTE